MSIEKLCVFCERLDFDYDAGGGGCPTCGYGGEGHAEMKCKKGHWQADVAWGLLDYRQKILRAETCPDYVQVEIKRG